MRISTSNVVKSFCAILLLGLLAVSCRKDPIFYIISTETAPIPPLIPGSPTNMVVFQREYKHFTDTPNDPNDPAFDPEAPYEIIPINFLFVASGRLHWYGSPDPANESPRWDRRYGIPQPGGKIISLAVTRKHLYALCLSGSSLRATLRRIGHEHDSEWQEVAGVNEYPLIQSIYVTDFKKDDASEPDQLFAGARRGDTYALLYLDDTDNPTLKLLKGKTEMLSGAAYRDNFYYLCTRGDGIFRIGKSYLDTNPTIDEELDNINVLQLTNLRKVQVKIDPDNPDPDIPDPDDPPPVDPPPVDPELKFKIDIQEGNKNLLFMSMIRLENKSIIVNGRNGGILYEILTDTDLDNLFNDVTVTEPSVSIGDFDKGRAFSQIFYDNGRSARTGGYAMSGLTLWEDDNRYLKKLVASRQGTLFSTSYNNGYIEFNLKYSGGSFDKKNPLNLMQTVDDYDRYSTNLEKQPINHLFQTPKEVDPERIFFASTQTGGLWSYRYRSGNGGWQWNAEN